MLKKARIFGRNKYSCANLISKCDYLIGKIKLKLIKLKIIIMHTSQYYETIVSIFYDDGFMISALFKNAEVLRHRHLIRMLLHPLYTNLNQAQGAIEFQLFLAFEHFFDKIYGNTQLYKKCKSEIIKCIQPRSNDFSPQQYSLNSIMIKCINYPIQNIDFPMQPLIYIILKILLKQNKSLLLSIRLFIAINLLMYVYHKQISYLKGSCSTYIQYILQSTTVRDLSFFVQSVQIRLQIFYRNKSLHNIYIKIINDQQLELKFNVNQIFISIKDMNQKEKGLQQIVQTSIMIKSKKEHIEKQTQELFHFFSEDYKYQDPMLLMGVRYKDKEKEFYTIKRQNQELKNKTRNLAEELDNLRNSLKDGQFIGNMRESISQDIPRQINLGASNFVNTTEDTDVFQIRKRLVSINKIKEQVFAEQKQSRKIFKERLQLFFNQLQRQHKTQLFKNYESSNKTQGKGEMITIPKDRYDKLIEIYSINVAENGLREFQKKFSSQQNQKKLEQIYQEKENFIKNYSNLLQDDKIAITNLHQLFEILANRAGFEKEWERYHRESQKESVAFKYKIDSILKNIIVNEIQQKNINEKAKKQVFVEKLDNVVQAIQFSQKQRQYWKQIKDKILADSFLNTQKIVKIARSEEESLKAEIGKMLAELISTSLKESAKSFQNFMEEKLNKVIKKDGVLLDQICVAEIQKCLVQDIQLFNCQKWLEITDKIITKKQQVIKNYQKKHFVFMSTNQIYRAKAKIK